MIVIEKKLVCTIMVHCWVSRSAPRRSADLRRVNKGQIAQVTLPCHLPVLYDSLVATLVFTGSLYST